jgi:carbamoyl-phosphate synthase large subunit
MNILLTCAGRRNYLIKFFQDALEGRGRVFAADASVDATTLQEADEAFVVPPMGNENYFDILLAICQLHQIRLLIPLNDLELPLLARVRERFREIGTIPIVSTPEVVNICFDKWATFTFLKACGLPAPKTFLSLTEVRKALSRGETSFPLVIKPRWGTGSVGIRYVEDEEEMELAYSLVKKHLSRTLLAKISATDPERCILVQERLHGHEYGLDVINDLEGHYVTTFVKRKLAMRAGETDCSLTVRDERLESLGEKIGQSLGHVGNLDCDIFVNEGSCYILEMNPRFGGGYPFSHIAGANLPATLIAWANGRSPDDHWLRIEPNIKAAKCSRLIVQNGDLSLSLSQKHIGATLQANIAARHTSCSLLRNPL